MSSKFNRRHLLQLLSIGSAGMAVPGLMRPQAAAAAQLPPSDPATALQALMDGNRRFAAGHPTYPHQAHQRLTEVSQSQHPFATVLTCADSRVPVEILFDQGVGDIFDVRVAGNIVTPEVMGSIEYAVELLETPILIVLGHERCGAVTAAVDNQPLPGDIGTFVEAILPAVQQAKAQSGDPVENAVGENVKYQLAQLKRSALVRDRLSNGTLTLIGARYDLDSGQVSVVV